MLGTAQGGVAGEVTSLCSQTIEFRFQTPR